MAQLNRFRPKPSHLISHRGPAVLITDLHGFVTGGVEGFYYRQTRFLSKFRFEVDGSPPTAVSANPVSAGAATAYFVAASPAGARAGPEPERDDSGGEIVRHGVEVQINRRVAGGVIHDIVITNHALAETEVRLRWEIDADFADYSEASKGAREQTAPVERSWRSGDGSGELEFRYRHPKLDHGCKVTLFGPDRLTESGGAIEWIVKLPRQSPVRLRIEVQPVFCGEPILYAPPESPDAGSRPQLDAGNPVVQAAWDRAVADLAALRLFDGEGDERLTPAAGIPKYIALFGRDTLVASFQAGMITPAMLRGTLSLVSRFNATTYDDFYDAQPGRVIHQQQNSPLALLGKNPFLHYYGDYSAPPWLLIDAAWHLALTGDAELFRSIESKLLGTLGWIERDADIDGDGLYEYRTRSSEGEKNQGWKDSNQAVLYEDGRMVRDPIAQVEIQGAFYAAKQLIGIAFGLLGDRERATRLLGEAAALKRRFNEAFWLPQEGYFALALDPDKRPVKTVASDPGQCLAYGIIDADKAKAVADRLMQPDLFSGWGLRTLSNRHPAYNPFAYHLGSVWPVSNALIAFGLKRHGFTEHLHRLAEAIFAASELFDLNRLPEVFGGHARDADHPHPGIYPDANSPQAWSASGVISLIQTMLGLFPAAPVGALIVDPELPEWLPAVTLRDIALGPARVSLRFERDPDAGTRYEVIAQEGELRVIRAPRLPAGEDRLAGALSALIPAD